MTYSDDIYLTVHCTPAMLDTPSVTQCNTVNGTVQIFHYYNTSRDVFNIYPDDVTINAPGNFVRRVTPQDLGIKICNCQIVYLDIEVPVKCCAWVQFDLYIFSPPAKSIKIFSII